jgi:hypothetical protein
MECITVYQNPGQVTKNTIPGPEHKGNNQGQVTKGKNQGQVTKGILGLKKVVI